MPPLHITEDDILKKLSNLNLNKSLGPVSVHPRVLYKVHFEICTSLKHIMELSMSTGDVPLDWSLGSSNSSVQKGSRIDVSNYRPVSLTCII